MSALRIGVNALYLIPGGVGGTEIYLRQLLKAMACIDSTNEYFVYTNRETGRDLVPENGRFHYRPQRVRARFRPARILWEQVVLPRALRRDAVDVLFNPGFTGPRFQPSVTVFHDLQHKRHPEHFRWFDLPFWRLLLWASARRSTSLIAVSQATAGDLMRFYGKPSVVIHHGVDAEFFALRREPGDYLLCVSTLHPHKNLERLVRAFQRIPGRLVLAGMRGYHAARVERLIRELRLENRIEITGWAPREQLLDLYRRARGFVYPSTFEGFGMPVLEAMAAGLPIACSDIPPLHEIASESVIYFDPNSEDAIVRAIENLPTEGSGRERAAQFTWERTARETLLQIEGAHRPK